MGIYTISVESETEGPLVDAETTDAITPSSPKSMVENVEEVEVEEVEEDTEVQISTISAKSEAEEPLVPTETTVAMTPSSRKSMVAKFFENNDEEEVAAESETTKEPLECTDKVLEHENEEEVIKVQTEGETK